MARKQMFTREIVTHEAVCTIFDMSSATMRDEIYVTEETEKGAALVEVREDNETSNLKILEVKEVREVRKMYGMYIKDFLAAAIELDPDTRKPLEK